MSLFRDPPRPDQQVAKRLGLQPGDIVISEMPYDDAERKDFEKFHNFIPSHSSVWAGEHLEKPFVRSHREVYTPPGLRMTNLWEGRHVVFRYIDVDIAALFARIMESWAAENSDRLFAEAHYDFHLENDLLFLFQQKELDLDHEGVLLACCFTALRDYSGEPHYRSGQRCTTILTAAFQASVLASIIKSDKEKNHFHALKDHTVHTFLEKMSVPGWQETLVGKKLVKALDQNNFAEVFPAPFSVDLRHANPRRLYNKLSGAIEFVQVGFFSFYENEIIAVQPNSFDQDSAA